MMNMLLVNIILQLQTDKSHYFLIIIIYIGVIIST